MDERLRRFTYDWGEAEGGPVEGSILVSVGKKGVGSVYLVVSSRLVQGRYVGRYALTCLPAPELKPEVETRTCGDSTYLYLRGEPCYPVVWYDRNPK